MTYGIGPSSRFTRVLLNAGDTIVDLPAAQPFPVLSAGDIVVSRRRAGIRTVLLLDADYSVELLDQLPGARVVLTAPAFAGDIVDVIGARPIRRLTDLQNGQKFDERTLNAEFDALTLTNQELRRDVDRAWKTDWPDKAGVIPILPRGHFPISDGDGNYVDGGNMVVSEQDLQEVLDARDQVVLLRNATAVDRAGAAGEAMSAAASAALAEGYAGQAQTDRERAELAADQTGADVIAAQGFAEAALANGQIYPDTTTGLAGTALNAYFWVATAADPTLLTLYRHNAGPTAGLIGTTLTSAATKARLSDLEESAHLYQRVGWQGTLATDAVKLAASEFIFADPAEFDSVFDEIELWAEAPTTIRFKSSRRRPATFHDYDQITFLDVAVGAGYNRITSAVVGGLTVAAGDFPAFWTPGATIPNPAASPADSGVPYYAFNTVTSLTSINDTTEAANFNPQVRIKLRQQRPVQTALGKLLDSQDGQDAELALLLSQITERQIIGIAGVPGAASGAGASRYDMATPALRTGFWSTLELRPNIDTWVTLHIAERVGNDNTVVWSKRYKVKKNEVNTLKPRRPIKKGQFVGVTGTRLGWCGFISPKTNAGYFNGTPVNGVLTDSTATTGVELQLRFTLLGQVADIETQLLYSALTRQKFLNFETAPVSGTGGGAGLVTLAATVQRPAVISGIDLYPLTPQTIELYVTSFDGLTHTVVAKVGDFQLVAGRPNFLEFERILQPGERFTFLAPFSSWCTYITQPGDGFYNKAAWDVAGVSYDDASATTSADLMIRIHAEELDLGGAGTGGGQVQRIGVSTSAKIISLEQSFGDGTYLPEGNPYLGQLQQACTEWIIDNWSAGGTQAYEMNDYLVAGVPIHGLDMHTIGQLRIVASMGKNNELEGTSQPDFIAQMRQLIPSMQAIGAQVTISTELDELYGPAGNLGLKGLADEFGCDFISMVPHAKEMMFGTVDQDLIQGSYPAAWHYGARTAGLREAQWRRYLKTLPRPDQRVMYYRLRPGISPSGPSDLAFDTDWEREQLWMPIMGGHRHMSPGDEQYVDKITPTATWMASGSDYVEQVSEFALFAGGGALAFGQWGMVDIICNGTLRNTDALSMLLSDPSIQVWVRDAYEGAPPPLGQKQWDWSSLPPIAGFVSIDREDLAGRMQFDRVYFLLHKPAGITMTEPAIDREGQLGKPAVLRNQPTPRGANIIAGSDAEGNKRFGALVPPWQTIGSLTYSTDATTMFPRGVAGIVTLSGGNAIQHPLQFTPVARDRAIVLRALARFFPPKHVPLSGTPAIVYGSVPHRELVMSLVYDAGLPGEKVYPFLGGIVGRWWEWPEWHAYVPGDVTNLAVRFSCAAGQMQFAGAGGRFID